MPVQDSNILFLFFFPWKQIGSWESMYRNVPVPHYGSSGAVTRVGSGQTPTHFFIHSNSSLALIMSHGKGQSQFCWSFRADPTKHTAILQKAPPATWVLSLLPLSSLPQSSSSSFLLPLFLPSPSPFWLRSQSKPATRANWKQVGKKTAKKF